MSGIASTHTTTLCFLSLRMVSSRGYACDPKPEAEWCWSAEELQTQIWKPKSYLRPSLQLVNKACPIACCVVIT